MKVGIYKRKQESKKERKQAFDQESDQEKNDNVQQKSKKHVLDQESKIQEKTITMKKKEGRERKTQIRIKSLAAFFRYIQFDRFDK